MKRFKLIYIKYDGAEKVTLSFNHIKDVIEEIQLDLDGSPYTEKIFNTCLMIDYKYHSEYLVHDVWDLYRIKEDYLDEN